MLHISLEYCSSIVWWYVLDLDKSVFSSAFKIVVLSRFYGLMIQRMFYAAFYKKETWY